MDIMNRSIMTKLAKNFWEFDEHEAEPITEVYHVDWDSVDGYIIMGGYLYFEEDPQDYRHITAYSYHIEGHGLITEFDCYNLEGFATYYYWVSELNNILPKDLYENWECQVSMLNEEE